MLKVYPWVKFYLPLPVFVCFPSLVFVNIHPCLLYSFTLVYLLQCFSFILSWFGCLSSSELLVFVCACVFSTHLFSFVCSLPVFVCFPALIPCEPGSLCHLCSTSCFCLFVLTFCLLVHLFFIPCLLSSCFPVFFISCVLLSVFVGFPSFLPSTCVCYLFVCSCVIKSLCFLYSSLHPLWILCSHVVLCGFCLSSVSYFSSVFAFCCLHVLDYQLLIKAQLLLFHLPLSLCQGSFLYELWHHIIWTKARWFVGIEQVLVFTLWWYLKCSE